MTTTKLELPLFRNSITFLGMLVQEDSLILARMSTLLPETHTLALVFRDIASLYNAGEDERRYILNLRTILPKVSLSCEDINGTS